MKSFNPFYQPQIECDRTIICDAPKHRRNCLGKTVSIEYYHRKLKSSY